MLASEVKLLQTDLASAQREADDPSVEDELRRAKAIVQARQLMACPVQ